VCTTNQVHSTPTDVRLASDEGARAELSELLFNLASSDRLELLAEISDETSARDWRQRGSIFLASLSILFGLEQLLQPFDILSKIHQVGMK
jgi:hypothetical protein